ncbi:hypothetical protein B9G98_01737 [Wickerhamiella sorbophila]|uniref:Uncharacterized protein n=1 Tax=Wickerhamiella sorbophila TaxID=45607 RepID=A0A2T0FGM9_9ASCO|nr:hypothetical protein B9G98_01737 [Wickerhamiella sorbophila]PRT54117.1 hypothetical protein B9G98_01737 [Wickerhamiella sorbophila]
MQGDYLVLHQANHPSFRSFFPTTMTGAATNKVSDKENTNPASPAKTVPSPSRKKTPLADCTDQQPGYATINGNTTELPHHRPLQRPRRAFDQAMAGVHKTVPYVSPSKRRSSPDKRLAAAYKKITHHLDFNIHEDSQSSSNSTI